jgi:hypothetical protein
VHRPKTESPGWSGSLDTFQTKLLSDSIASDDVTPDWYNRTGNDEREGEEEKEEEGEVVVLQQPTLTVATHPPPCSSSLTMFPVFVDYEGIIYAHDVAEGRNTVVLPTGCITVVSGFCV